MQFQIKKIILWPRKGFDKREINFVEGQVNVISGASKTGKSAVIPIIDYCLCSNKCSIPVGVIREECEWFGVLVSSVEGDKLFARREPGEKKQTGDMFVLEGEAVEIPVGIEEKNATVDQAKTILNRLSGLSSLGMNPQSEGFGSNRTGFRDLMAFTFQPQNIVANPDVLFFKADTTEHREKLKSIFPYVLNAVTQETLADRWEMDRLQKILRQKEAAMKAAESSVQTWVSEAVSWIQRARELGLIDVDRENPTLWPDILDLLVEIVGTNSRRAQTSVLAVDGALEELSVLQNAEAEEAGHLTVQRQRLLEIRRLIDSSQTYGEAMFIQRDRLAISSWIRNLSSQSSDALAAVSSEGAEHLDQLCAALEGLELEVQSQATISDKLDKEQLRLRSLAEESISRLNGIRTQIRELERRSDEARAEIYRADQIERYLGRLEQAISLYERTGEDAELKSEVEDLQEKIGNIRGRISEQQIQVRIANALASIENIAGQILPTLDAEWPDAAINFMLADLTIKVVQGTRDDYLWEIGSGANWLAYHISMTLAFQRFFLQTPAHPVPNFLIYDQPSQVYFPQSPRDDELVEAEWENEDIDAVRSVFSAMSSETRKAKGNLQVIVLDHADEQVWGDIDNVVLTARWRDGEKLVPVEWFQPESRS
ncbi:MAG: DUF3732 domain-containing protein [Parvibaculaceae bacterium]|nr:DUF3732 domain-containing protein [Parvibaculaceae bacterium]|tara:strand:- start:5495 stop:7462 length:1968 start_codon:yes stop_codon:yes gene_type:complete